jgi:hypothetical protein
MRKSNELIFVHRLTLLFRVTNSEVYGTESKCITVSAGEARCYRTACVQDDMTLRINVRGEWLKCEYDFQRLDVVVGQGAIPLTLICPPLHQACPALYCPFNCAGRGSCNYSAVNNGTVRPSCECFAKNDTSLGCSESQVPSGDFLSDASNLRNNLEENFFGPLAAVFVDHPDKWTTSSWAWAAGLIAVFFVILLCICSSCWPQRVKQIP